MEHINTSKSEYAVYTGSATFTGMNRALQDPLAFWTPEMRASDIAVFDIFGRKSVVVFDPDLVGHVLLDKDGRFTRSEIANKMLVPALGEGLLTISGEQWRAHRKVVARAFRHEALQTLVPGMHRAATALADRLVDARGADVDVVPEMMQTTFDVIQTMLFGDAAVTYDQGCVLKDVSSYLGSMGQLDVFDLIPVVNLIAGLRHVRGYRAARRFRSLADEAIATIRAQPQDAREPTLAAMLIEAQDHGNVDGFTDAHVVDNIITFVGAGHETTSLALSWALHVLSERPGLWAELQAEACAVPAAIRGTAEALDHLGLHDRVIRETMRLYPPVPQIARTVAKPLRLGGVTLHADDHVTIAIEPMHLKEEFWPDPYLFDPDRFTEDEMASHHRYQYLPFGGGQHICIGMRLALWEAQLILSALTERFDLAPSDNPVAVEKSVKVTMRPRNGLPLKFIPAQAEGSGGSHA